MVVVVAGAATAGQLRSPDRLQPAEQVVGVDVPGSIDVLGFPYDLERTSELTDGDVRVRKTSTDQAVTLAASGLGSGSATLYQDDEAVARVRSGEPLAVPLPIYDASSTFRVGSTARPPERVPGWPSTDPPERWPTGSATAPASSGTPLPATA